MGKLSYGFNLSSKPNKQGLYSVVFRITHDRVHKRITTSFVVKKENWNQSPKTPNHHYRATQSQTDAKVLNEHLSAYYNKCDTIRKKLDELGVCTIDNLIREINGGDYESFLKFAINHTQGIYDSGGIRNYKKYNNFCNKLKGYLQTKRKSDVSFKEIDLMFLSDFKAYLHKIPNERHPDQLLHPNSIQAILNAFKAIMKEAYHKHPSLIGKSNPFDTFKYSGEITTKEKLSIAEIRQIINLDIAEGTLMWHCRNYFLFSFYCAGIRVGDLIQLRWRNITSENKLEYVMDKNGKKRDVPLIEDAIAILDAYRKEDSSLDDYIFPLLDNNATWAKYLIKNGKSTMPSDLKAELFRVIGSKTALINKTLKQIQCKAEITKKITFHISRHSFAKIAKDSGADNLQVKKWLGHSNLSTTERYMGDFDAETNDKAMVSMFDGIRNEEDKVSMLYNQLKGIDPQILAKVLDRLNKE